MRDGHTSNTPGEDIRSISAPAAIHQAHRRLTPPHSPQPTRDQAVRPASAPEIRNSDHHSSPEECASSRLHSPSSASACHQLVTPHAPQPHSPHEIQSFIDKHGPHPDHVPPVREAIDRARVPSPRTGGEMYLARINQQRQTSGTREAYRRPLHADEIAHAWHHPWGHIAYITYRNLNDKIWEIHGHNLAADGFTKEGLPHAVEQATKYGQILGLQGVETFGVDLAPGTHRYIYKFNYRGQDKYLAIQADETGKIYGVNESSERKLKTARRQMYGPGSR